MPDRDKSQILTLRRLVERRLVALLDEFCWAGARSPVRDVSRYDGAR
jgi:hypothetical protein